MKIVSVINYKGGVGKTTLTANLGAELAWRGYNVLMVDLDAQASLTFSLITPDDWQKNYADSKTIKKWFDSFEMGKPFSLSEIIFTPDRIAETLDKRDGSVDLIASHLGLINVDLELATKLGGANLTQAKRNFLSVHRVLSEGLDQINADNYDLVLIDCPPNFNIVTKTAIIASDYILVPARPDYLSTLGIDYLIRSTNTLIKEYNEYAALKQETGEETYPIDPKFLYVVFTMIQEYRSIPIAAQRPFIEQASRLSGVEVMAPYIKRNDTIFGDVGQFGVPAVLNGYHSGSHQSVVDGLEAVTNKFISGIGL